MNPSLADDGRQKLAVDEALRSAEETAAGAHDLTPCDSGQESTQSFLGGRGKEDGDSPQQIGRYRVLRPLGRGAFGQVWLAMDDELRRQVAIKVVSAARLPELEDAEAYLAEARALAALDHPHIVPIFDVGRKEDGSVYVVSKYVEGQNLRERIGEARVPNNEAADIIAALAEALHHAHEKKLIHRDIKPANILIETATGRVYLADFGLAVRPEGSTVATFAGTPAYMSPEQIRCQAVDARSDLFSLGVVFYELLAGKRPFAAPTAQQLFQQISEARARPLQEVDDTIQSELARISHKLLAKNPSDRYSSGRDLAADLRGWAETERRKGKTVPTNIPLSPGILVGREREVEEIGRRLEGGRLITLTGPGGIGKTCLAIAVSSEVRERFPDGVFLVELAAISDPVLVPVAIAQAIGCRQQSQRPVIEEVLDFLAGKQLLLVLDNFEQILAASQHVARLQSACSEVRIIATSRAPLRIAGEQEFPVSLLTLPDLQSRSSAAELRQYSAVALFVQRAREVLPSFELDDSNAPAVAGICVRLDGLPLAIELAAARVKILSPQQLLERLQKSLQLLSTRRPDLPERQQTLRAAIAWSCDLLPPADQALFRRLAVFSGGFTLAAAEQVAAGDQIEVIEGITSLVDHSLLRCDRSKTDSGRFYMLETVREFACEALRTSGEADPISHHHATWLVQMAEEAEPQLRGPEAAIWTRQLEAEQPNVRAALAWCLADPPDGERGELGLRLAGALWRFWCSSGYLREADDWLTRLLAAFGDARRDSVGAKSRYAAGCVAEDLGKLAEARQLYEAARELWQQTGDDGRLPDALIALGSIASSQGDYSAAGDFFQHALALARGQNDRRVVSVALSNLGSVAWSGGDYDRAKGYHEEALTIRRELGNRAGVAVSLTSLGLIASRRGDLQGAKILYSESLAILRELDNKSGVAVCLNNLGEIMYRLGEFESGEALLWEALQIQHEIGDRLSLAYTLESIAAAAQLQGSSEAAVRFFAAAETLRESLGAPLPPPEKVSNDCLIQEVRVALGPERFIALWTAAKTIPLERLVEEGRK